MEGLRFFAIREKGSKMNTNIFTDLVANDKDYGVSDVTGKRYRLKDAQRILNIHQAMLYLSDGVELYDLYPSRDFKTGDPVLVFVFSRSQSKESYDKWMQQRNAYLAAKRSEQDV